MRIISKTITQILYVSEDGRETPVTEMGATHIVNALLKAEREEEPAIVEVLKKEIVRRLTPTEA